MGLSSPTEPFPASADAVSSSPIEMGTIPAQGAASSSPPNQSPRSPQSHHAQFPSSSLQPRPRINPIQTTTTIAQERRASIVNAAGAGAHTTGSLPRRLSKSFQESEVPRGFLAATADMTSSMVAAARPRSGTARSRSSTVSDPDERKRALQQQRTPSKGDDSALATLDEQHRPSASFEKTNGNARGGSNAAAAKIDEAGAERASFRDSGEDVITDTAANADVAAADAQLFKEYDNGYHFPPKYSKKESFRHGMLAFWNYFKTPVGFLVVIYGLNVVAWGGMIFLLLCNAAPAMCYPTCNDINSPRRKWIEYDSQILNALFCVTGFGLAPWRFRDTYYLLQYYLAHGEKSEKGLRRLAGVHRSWIRLPGSENLPVDVGPGNVPPETPCSAIPFPESKTPDAPLTGERAPPTKMGRINFIIVMNLSNTLLQAVLSGFMWGMNRYKRPSWSTGLFVALACIAGAVGGLYMFLEGKKVKSIEGVPLTDEDRAKLVRDRAQGIYHYNNIKGKKPKEKQTDEEAALKK